MAESFSVTAYRRLPSAIRKLSKEAQTVCIHLRIGKTEERISLDTGLSPDETARLVEEVKRTLIVSGNYDIIAEPVFVPLDDPDAYLPEPSARETGMEENLMLKDFLDALRGATASLDTGEKRLLHLFFERRMTGAQILAFTEKASWNGPPAFRSLSDVFHAIEKTLARLLGKMEERTPIGRGTLTVKGLKEVFSHTGFPA